MFDRETLQLVAALAEASTRTAAAAALAAQLGADALLLFVDDPEVEALLPAPGLPQTVAGGSAWRAFLLECRAHGVHHGSVGYPSADETVPALACSGSGVALVFVGRDCARAPIEAITVILPLLGSTLRAEHAAASASSQAIVAREDARHTGELARSLEKARADLERQAKSLNEARARAEDATRVKDQFLAMLGHELRNPLAPMKTALQLLRMQGVSSREHEVLERQVTQLMRLVDDLLDVSRIASGKVELRKERLELSEVTARAVEIASPLLEQKQQVLSVQVPAQGIPIEGDAARLAQIFSNLLTNAAKYSPVNARVTLTAERKGDRAIVRVKDEGFGIEPHMLDAIFDLFTQQQQSVDRSQGGLGLGLAIVRNLVTLHGGTVRAMSEGRGKGSEVLVELPTSSVDSPVVDTRLNDGIVASEKTIHSSRILVVDDNEDAAQMMSEILADLGYVVRTASDGPSALIVAAEFQPQIALLDIGLPVMDGYELCRNMREAYPAQSLRLVALTGYGQASDKARSREAGFDAHLVKPVDIRQLQLLLGGLNASSPPP